MLKTVKNIRKLNNAKLLVISNDSEIKNSFEKELNEYFKEIKILTNALEAIELAATSSFDIVLIDTSIDGCSFSQACSELTQVAPTLPKIIVSNDENNDDIVTAINNSAYTFTSKPLRLIDIKFSVIMCLNQTKRGDKYDFQHGIYFDEYRDQFYKAGGALIDFTRLEKSFLKLLIIKKGDIIDYDLIRNVVWKGKNMSIYTMRNIVNKIRQKTYYEIIRNHSNKGYVIDEVKN